MKLDRLAAGAVAAFLFATSPALSGPVLPPEPALAQPAPIELAHWRHHHRHRHHYWGYYSSDSPSDDSSYASDEVTAEDAVAALFWPIWGDSCFYGQDCGYAAAYDPGCHFYGCSYGWNMGPFAWGLFGLGFFDPYGIFGLAYGYPLEAGFDYATLGVNIGAIDSGVGARPFVSGPFLGRHFAARGYRGYHGPYGGGFRHWGRHAPGFHDSGHFAHGYRMHGFRHFGGFHRFGGRHMMAFHGFHGGGGHGFHGGGFHGGGFHGGGFHGGGGHGHH